MGQTVWIARHANRLDFVHPEWFDTAELPYDPPLSDDGMEQAKALARRLAGENIAHIFASPFLRTVQTACAVAQVLDLPVKLEAGLSEFLTPEWFPVPPQRRSRDELLQLFPRIDAHYQSRLVPEYPETDIDCAARTREIAQILTAEFPEDILFVGHGASVEGTALGLAPDTEWMRASLCSLTKCVRKGDKWVMELKSDTSHLSLVRKSA
ncbi:MAG: histidine phosphatase family protein [Oscillatoriaceae cyanobacterium]